MEEKLELMNEMVELAGEAVDTGEVVEAVADNVGIMGKVLKYGIPVVLVAGTGALVYFGVKKFKKAKEDKIVYTQEEVEVTETVVEE